MQAWLNIYNYTIEIISNVYMPYFSSSNLMQTEQFLSTIDDLQSVVDKHGSSVPITICGDLNVALPRRANIPGNWFKSKGFNSHSNIMFDFINVNNLTVTDFAESQCVNYTYFSHTTHYTWIDHILTTDDNVSRIKSCQIGTQTFHSSGIRFASKPYFRNTFRTQTIFQKDVSHPPKPYSRKTFRTQNIFQKDVSPTNHI